VNLIHHEERVAEINVDVDVDVAVSAFRFRARKPALKLRPDEVAEYSGGLLR